MQEDNVPISMTTSQNNGQKGDKKGDVNEHANNKYHVVTLLVNIDGHSCNLRYIL